MYVIDVDNVNEALPEGLNLLTWSGKPVVSRGMATTEMPGPVSTVYRNPTRRVLFDANRDANPFFHLMESLWIIGGSNRVALPKYFMDNIDRFSDDGETFNGAYGHRLRNAFGYDQLPVAINILRNNPDSRQVVLSLWDGHEDLGSVTKDLPCNDLIMFKVREGRLNMTVCNRSNDAIWGAYGANVVQFSMLQEWLAASLDLEVGHYVQQSDSFHVYEDNPFWVRCLADENYPPKEHIDPYESGDVVPYPLVHGLEQRDRLHDSIMFLQDCERLCLAAESGRSLVSPVYRSTYFIDVVVPVIYAYNAYKAKDYEDARLMLTQVKAEDWQLAMSQWVQRRADKAAAKVQA